MDDRSILLSHIHAALQIAGSQPRNTAVVVNMYGRAKPGAGSSPTAYKDGWTSPSNGKNLDGWYTWLPSTSKNNDPKRDAVGKVSLLRY